MTEFESYISKFSPEVRERLIKIRQIALATFPNAEEKTCHSLPAFFINGQGVMFFGAYKNHISICVGDDWVDFLKTQYPQFHYTGHTITFQHNEPFPDDVVQVICDLLSHRYRSGSTTNAIFSKNPD